MKRTLQIFIGLWITVWLLPSCTHDPVVAPVLADCFTEDVSFRHPVDSILKNNCYGCHTSVTPNGGVDLTDFEVIAQLVVNGKLSGVSNHREGFSPMPPGFLLDSCSLQQIDRWIADTIATIDRCDTLEVTFSRSVDPVMQANCYGCHGRDEPAGGIAIRGYNDVVALANDGRLTGVLRHREGFSPMPQNGPQLNECTLTEIETWISDGTPDN